MIKDPIALVLVLLSIETALLLISTHPRCKHWFDFIPVMFWIYFLPMCLSTCGLMDAQSPLYADITRNFLGPALFLLLR